MMVDTILRDDDHQAGDEFKTLLTLQRNFDVVVRDRHKKFSKNILESKSPLIFLFYRHFLNYLVSPASLLRGIVQTSAIYLIYQGIKS